MFLFYARKKLFNGLFHQRPLPLHQILRLVRCLKLILFKVLRDDPSLLLDARTSSQSVLPATPVANGKAPAASPPLPSSSSLAEEGVHGAQQASRRRQLHYSMRAVSSVLADLYSRWARRPFSSSALWEIKVFLSASLFLYFF